MAKVRDVHVRRLFALLGQGRSLGAAARLTGIDRKTARRYRDMKRLPSEKPDAPRHWRTRSDPFAQIWPEVVEQLARAPTLQVKTIWGWLRHKYPGRFDDGQLRTLQRRVHDWRATQGPGREVYFGQLHPPGRLCASDFTHMKSLNVTIGGQRFDHMVYHFVLTYSNWESVTVCFAESFESLSEGLQNALQELGGVPERHRSDRMSGTLEFTTRDSERFVLQTGDACFTAMTLCWPWHRNEDTKQGYLIEFGSSEAVWPMTYVKGISPFYLSIRQLSSCRC